MENARFFLYYLLFNKLNIGGAITLSKEFLKKYNKEKKPDLIISTDMLDLSLFLSLTREITHNIKTIIYFHENQLTYPKNENEKNLHTSIYSFINFTSMLSSNKILFNSNFHFNDFTSNVKKILNQQRDNNEFETIEEIKKKSDILYVGVDLNILNEYKILKKNFKEKIIIWNHRWFYINYIILINHYKYKKFIII
jgi:hypothetical protein